MFKNYLVFILVSTVFLIALLAPSAQASAQQLEIGFDAGMKIENSAGLRRTTFKVPGEWVRVGFRGERVGFESLLSFTHQRVSGQKATVITFLPGLTYAIRPGIYVRGEAGVFLLSDPYGSASQFGYGVATGTRRRLGGPLFFRLETGITKWGQNRDYNESKNFRFLAGLSVAF